MTLDTGHAAQPGADRDDARPRGQGLAAGRARPDTHAHGRALAAALAEPASARPCRRWSSGLTAVERLLQRPGPPRLGLRDALRDLGDLERLTNRVMQGIARPRDLLALQSSLAATGRDRATGRRCWREQDAAATARCPYPLTAESLAPLDALGDLIARALVRRPSRHAGHGGVIRRGYSAELDDIEQSVAEAKRWVAGLERVERERTGIKNAQGRLQQGLWLLHRDHPQPTPRPCPASISASRRWSTPSATSRPNSRNARR